MSELVILGSAGGVITSVDQWFEVAPPRGGAAQWSDGYSAKELAKAWFRSGVVASPKELVSLFASSALTRGAQITHAVAARATHFDANGGPRKHDLLLQLRRDDEVLVAGIEAKVKESLGPRVVDRIEAADAAKEGSRVRARVDELVAALFGRTLEEVKLGALRYQLLTAAAATLVEARERRAGAALLVIHDLGATAHAPDVFTATQLDVSDFVIALGGDGLPLAPGRLYGPFKIAGSTRVPANVSLHVALIEATARR